MYDNIRGWTSCASLRIFGARRAKGEVLVFLDSHVEVKYFYINTWIHVIYERS